MAINRLDFSVTNVKIDIKEVTANEVRVNVNNNGRHVEAVIKKAAQVVTSTFYLDNKLVQVDKRGLQEATVLGNTMKKNASAMQRGETGNTTGGAQIQRRVRGTIASTQLFTLPVVNTSPTLTLTRATTGFHLTAHGQCLGGKTGTSS